MKLCALGCCKSALTNCQPHTHQLWEFCIDTRGRGVTSIGGREYPFAEGTITCIPPNTVHSKAADDGFWDYYFHTDAFLTPSGQKFPEDQPIFLQDDSTKTLETLVKTIFNLYYQKKPEERGIVLSLFRDFMQLLSVRISSDSTLPLVEQVKSRIISDFTNPEIDLTAILQSAAYSENYMRQKFKEETGMTPTGYLTHLRIDYAKHLLEQKKSMNLTIGHIAEMCGYYDERYFSRVFHGRTGLSPREYFLQYSMAEANNDLDRPV